MEAISFLSNWISWLLLIIPAGAAFMVAYLAIRKGLSSDEGVISDCNTKIKHVLIGSAIGMGLSGLVTILRNFYLATYI